MPVGLMIEGGAQTLDRTLDRYSRAGLSEIYGQQNIRATVREHRTGHTPNPRIGIKIPDPAGNRTRAAGLEGRDSTDHATATDMTNLT